MWSSVGVKDNCKQCNGCEIPFEDNRNQHRQYLEGMNNFIFLWRHFIHSTEFRKAINQQQKGPSSFLNLTVMHLKQPQSNISKNYNCIQLLEGKVLSPYRDLHLLPPLASISKINTIDQDKRGRTFLLDGPLSECLKNLGSETFCRSERGRRETDVLTKLSNILTH